MRCAKSQRYLRAAAVGLLTLVGLAGGPKEAPAFQFNNGDLVLAIFGNNTEFYYDIGTNANLLTPGTQTTINVSAAFAAGAGVVGGPQTQWTIIGRDPQPAIPAANGIYVYAGSQNTSANISIVPAISQTNTRVQAWDAALNLSTGPTPAGLGAQVFLSSLDPAAFTNPNNFNLSGTLGGSWNAGGMQGSLDSILTIIQGRARNEAGLTNVLSNAGQAVLSASGLLTICGGAGCSVAAVPVPAAVILFGSGLIGLVGIARRTGTKMIA